MAELNSMHQEIPDDCYSRLYDLILQLLDGKIGEKMNKKIEEIEILLKDLDNKGVFKYHKYDYDKILKLLYSLNMRRIGYEPC